MPDPEVLISGAGPTGLLLALWLTRLGVRVRIVDLKPGPTTETRAIIVQARTLEFYDQLGLGRETMAHGRRFEQLAIFARGNLAARVRLGGVGDDLTPHPYLYIFTQDQNEALLLAHLEALGGAVSWETELTGFTQDADGVTATLRRDGQSETVRAAYLAGCDGARSTVRQTLEIPLAGGTYADRFYVADVVLSGKLSEGDGNLFITDDRFIAVFPMVEPHRYRIVGQVPPDAGEQPDFEQVRPQIEASGALRIEALVWFSSYRVHHRVADRLGDGRAFLLGDAGHVHSPVGGQGMNTGLGDAANLAWKLAQTLGGGGNEALLNSYEAERRPFAVSLVRTTDRVFSAVVNPSRLARLVRLTILPRLIALFSRSKTVRRALFGLVSQLRIHYPTSPLSSGQAGRVRGGDRLPWVPQATGSNFDALRTLGWQMHIYGEPPPEAADWCAARTLPLHVFPFTSTTRRAGFSRNALCLVRPDGHVGLAVTRFDRARLDAYADRWLAPASRIYAE